MPYVIYVSYIRACLCVCIYVCVYLIYICVCLYADTADTCIYFVSRECAFIYIYIYIFIYVNIYVCIQT